MNIGYDAKRVFYNRSGLGNYGRNIINALSTTYYDLGLILYAPIKKNPIITYDAQQIKTIYPNSAFHKKFGSLWRTFYLGRQIKKDNLDLFHGLSNELPHNIQKREIKTIVTIHDLIFLRYPQLYKAIDRYIYNKKFKYACHAANKIIAISKQTKDDIVEFYKIERDKIEVVYQGCNPIFYNKITKEQIVEIRKIYQLPSEFMLTVGTIEKRKNLLTIVKAIREGNIDIPLVVVGKPTKYLDKVKEYIAQYNINKVHILNYINLEDLPGLYQLATLFIYPSVFEGFGIPVLEALNSGVPVISTNYGCFIEAGGKAAQYVNPEDSEEMADKIKEILTDSNLQKRMVEAGYEHAKKFREEIIAKDLLNVYKKVVNHAG